MPDHLHDRAGPAGRPLAAPLSTALGIYAGALLSFLAGFLRDGSALALPDSGRRFFEVMYVASLASVWGINAIQLGTAPPTRREVLQIGVLCSAALAIGSVILPIGSPIELATALCVSLMWTIGAVASRAQLARGSPISARAREAVSSLAIAGLLVVGCDATASIAVGVAVGTAWMLRASWDVRSAYFRADAPRGTMTVTIRSIVSSNVAIVMMTLWAMYVNRLETPLLGFPAQGVARAATYVFQAIAIGWMVLAVRSDIAPGWIARHGVLIGTSIFGAAIACTVWSVEASCIAMPVLAGLGQYTLIAASAASARSNTP